MRVWVLVFFRTEHSDMRDLFSAVSREPIGDDLQSDTKLDPIVQRFGLFPNIFWLFYIPTSHCHMMNVFSWACPINYLYSPHKNKSTAHLYFIYCPSSVMSTPVQWNSFASIQLLDLKNWKSYTPIHKSLPFSLMVTIPFLRPHHLPIALPLVTRMASGICVRISILATFYSLKWE